MLNGGDMLDNEGQSEEEVDTSAIVQIKEEKIVLNRPKRVPENEL